MTNTVCRVCLCVNKSLRRLDEQLSSYFIEICESKSHPTIHLCCTTCKDSLKNNLDFRNQCRKSNQIFHEWEKDTSRDKIPIESIHKLLSDTNSTEYLEIAKLEESLSKDTENGVDDIKEEIKVESRDSDHNDNETVYTETLESNIVSKVSKNVNSKKPRKRKSMTEIISKVPKKYELRGEIAKRSAFTQFETVFDIELFATYEEARKELLSRRVSEPYLSAQHRCELCYTVYKNEGLLLFHMKWHDVSPDLSHECDVCSMRFASRATLLKHKPNCHRGKFACKMCPLITYQRQTMRAHFQKHQGKIYKCHCDRVFKHISSYMTHRRLVHTSSHVCAVCARTFVSELGLKTHTFKMHPIERDPDSEESVRCEPCGLTLANRQVYVVHVMHTDAHKDIAASLVACSVCGISFEDMTQVKEHRRLNHHRPKLLTKENPKKTSLSEKDGEKKVGTEYVVITCKLCGATGSCNQWLYQHYRSEHPGERYEREATRGRRDFLCEQCGRGFYHKVQLEEHKYVHSGLKPHRCGTCHKAFRTKLCLKVHSERHTPASRECSHCGKKFNSAANLSNHKRSHTGDRRFVCAQCGKGFLHRAALNEHTRGVHLHIRRERKTQR